MLVTDRSRLDDFFVTPSKCSYNNTAYSLSTVFTNFAFCCMSSQAAGPQLRQALNNVALKTDSMYARNWLEGALWSLCDTGNS